jgi:hypothetical protein
LQSRIVVVCIQNKENGANGFFAWPWHLNPIAWPETHYYSLLSPLQITGSKESTEQCTALWCLAPGWSSFFSGELGASGKAGGGQWWTKKTGPYCGC